MGITIKLFYRDRDEDDRVTETLRAMHDLSDEDIARYLVQLEMRLESLGNREHFGE